MDEPKNQPTLSKKLSNNFVAAAKSTLPSTSTSTDYDNETYEAPPSLMEMTSLYGPGLHILAKNGYNGNGCGAQEQGIKVPLQNNARETSFRLGYNTFKPTKASKRPSLYVNVIFSSSN